MLAFTGTKDGWTSLQQQSAFNVLSKLENNYHVMHNGDCIGADEIAAWYWKKKLGQKLVLHPPSNPKYRAWIDYADTMMPEGPYLERDHRMVDLSSILVGTPKCEEYLRSGTWATIRYARKIGIPRILIYPNGSITTEAGTNILA